MKIWVYLNGIQQGPYTLDELRALSLTASTPVWYEGLAQWMPASEAPLTSAMFSGETPEVCSCDPAHENCSCREASIQPKTDVHPCPKTYLGWAIASLICCCVIGGVIAIILTVMTTSAYNRGDYAKAAKMGEYAEWAIILSIVFGLVTMPLSSILWL